MEWNEKLEVGHELIDAQHKELFKRIKELTHAMDWEKESAEVDKLLVFLEEYVVEHFAAEEALMEEHAHEEAEFHKNRHASFVRDFQGFKKELKEKGLSMDSSVRTQAWLVGWLYEHIAGTDKALAGFIKRETP